MKSKQSGFAPLLAVFVVMLLIGVGWFSYSTIKKQKLSENGGAQVITTTSSTTASFKAPTNLRTHLTNLDSKGKKGVQVIWDDNSSNETGFWVVRSLTANGKDWEVIKKVSANSAGITDTDVQPNKKYYYRIKAIFPAFIYKWSNISNINVPTPTPLATTTVTNTPKPTPYQAVPTKSTPVQTPTQVVPTR